MYWCGKVDAVLINIGDKFIKLPAKMARFKSETIIERVCFMVRAGMQ